MIGLRMNALFCVVLCCCLPVLFWVTAACKDYLDGDVPQHSISLVETLTVSEPFRVVTVHFRDSEIPCHEQRSWYTGYSKLRTLVYESRFEQNGTCFSQTALNITEHILTPTMDVVYSRVNGNYSTVKPICIDNVTAYYIKLQRCPNSCPKVSTMGIISSLTKVVGPSSTVAVPQSSISLSVSTSKTAAVTNAVKRKVTTTELSVLDAVAASAATTTVVMLQRPIPKTANIICMTYILPSLSTVIGILVVSVIVMITAVLVYIKCSKSRINAVSVSDGIHNPMFGI